MLRSGSNEIHNKYIDLNIDRQIGKGLQIK